MIEPNYHLVGSRWCLTIPDRELTERESYQILDDIRGLPYGTSYREMIKFAFWSTGCVLSVFGILLFAAVNQ